MTDAATPSQTTTEALPGYKTGFGTPLYRGYVLSSLLVVYIFNFIDRSIFGILTEPMKLSLKLEDWHMGLLGGLAFAIFYTTLGIPIARIAERRSRMMIIIISLTLWSLMTVLCGFATSFITLFIFRLLVGVRDLIDAELSRQGINVVLRQIFPSLLDADSHGQLPVKFG